MTPIDLDRWSHLANWNAADRKWFAEHIPLYQLDCLMGMDPIRHSVRNYLDTILDNPSNRPNRQAGERAVKKLLFDAIFSPPSDPLAPTPPPALPQIDFGTPPIMHWFDDDDPLDEVPF